MPLELRHRWQFVHLPEKQIVHGLIVPKTVIFYERNGGFTMTSEEMKEALELLIEYAQTGMLCIDERQRQLLKRYSEEMSK